MRRSVIRIIVSIILAVTGFVMKYIAAYFPDFITDYYVPFSRTVMLVFSKISGIVPFSLAEILLYTVVISAVVGLAITVCTVIRNKGRRLNIALKSLSIYMLVLGSAAFFFYLSWGLAYSQNTLASQMALNVRPRPTVELKELCLELVSTMNRIRPQVQEADFKTMSIDTARNFNIYTNCNYPRVKPVLLSEQMSYLMITGIFIPFTGESNVNTNDLYYSTPFVMAHEMSHRHGVAREDEANFYAYVVCSNATDSPLLQYSAAFKAFEYSITRLYSVDIEAWRDVYGHIDETVLTDLIESDKHWAKYKGKASTTMNKINNTYLKTQGQSDGVNSYGRMVDLLLAFRD